MLKIRVVVRDLTRDRIVHDRIGDHNDPEFRKWMGRTAYWAVRNNHSMWTAPED